MVTPEEVAIQRQVGQDKVIAWSSQNGIKNSSMRSSSLRRSTPRGRTGLQMLGKQSTLTARRDWRLQPVRSWLWGRLPQWRCPSHRPFRKVGRWPTGLWRAPPFQHLPMRLRPVHMQLARTSLWRSCWGSKEYRPETAEADKEALRAFVLKVAQKADPPQCCLHLERAPQLCR